MSSRYLLAISIIVLFFSFGCSKELPAGTYIRSDQPSNFIDLKLDGTFFLLEEGKIYSGKYRVEDSNKINIESDGGVKNQAILEGTTLIVNGKERWIKR